MYLIETKTIKLRKNICIHSDIIIKNNAPFFKELFPFVELFNPWNSLSTSDLQYHLTLSIFLVTV